jgi:hypothetical protein
MGLNCGFSRIAAPVDGRTPAKAALTAVMRKLIVLMNHILKQPDFVPQD